MQFKIIFVIISLLSISGCGPSAEEKEEMSYENGYSAGHREGYMEALKCVEREEGFAEEAADYCKRRM